MKLRMSERGFALPTVVLASLILMIVLAGSLSIASSSSVALREQYDSQIMREAAEAGLLYANKCYLQVSEIATAGQWPNTGTLETGEDCYGAPIAGANCGTPSATSVCYVMTDSSVRTRFSVTVAPAGVSPTAVSLSAIGYVDKIRTSTNTVSDTYKTSVSSDFSIDIYGMASGNDTTCAIIEGRLYCWGRNDTGQVGVGTTTTVTKPTLIQGALAGKYVHAVATGINHTCAVTGPNPLPGITKFTDGSNASTKIYCWGDNSLGQFGNAAWTDTLVPEASRVLNMTDHYATAISGRDYNCIIAVQNSNTSINHNYCWGDNNQKQAGRSANCATASDADTPDPKPAFGCSLRWSNATNAEITDTLQLSAVTSGTACGVIASESKIIWCKGNGDQGTLGNGSTVGDEPRAVRVRDSGSVAITGVSKVATNNGRACALATYGSPAGLPKLFCWGSNWDSAGLYNGALQYQIDSRLGSTQYGWATQMQTNRSDTTYVFYNRAVSDFAISDWNTCFISAGVVYCSGYNDEGQLGQGHTNGPAGTPSVAQGYATSGSQVRSIEWAVPVAGALAGKTAVTIVGGNNHFCVTTDKKEVYCWGSNDFGQLGDGTTTDRWLPVKAGTPKVIIY